MQRAWTRVLIVASSALAMSATAAEIKVPTAGAFKPVVTAPALLAGAGAKDVLKGKGMEAP